MGETIIGWGSADAMFLDFDQNKYWYDREAPRPPRDPDPEHYEALFGCYWSESYDGTAFVLVRDRRDGLLYTVQGGHCSCHGLEGQWSPVRVTKASLMHEILNGTLGRDSYFADGNFAAPLLLVVQALPEDGS